MSSSKIIDIGKARDDKNEELEEPQCYGNFGPDYKNPMQPETKDFETETSDNNGIKTNLTERPTEDNNFYSDDFVINMKKSHMFQPKEWIIPGSSKFDGNVSKQECDGYFRTLQPHDQGVTSGNDSQTYENRKGPFESNLIKYTNSEYFNITKPSSDILLRQDHFIRKEIPFYLQSYQGNYFEKIPAQSFFVYPVKQNLPELRKKNQKLRQQLETNPPVQTLRKSTGKVEAKKSIRPSIKINPSKVSKTTDPTTDKVETKTNQEIVNNVAIADKTAKGTDTIEVPQTTETPQNASSRSQIKFNSSKQNLSVAKTKINSRPNSPESKHQPKPSGKQKPGPPRTKVPNIQVTPPLAPKYPNSQTIKPHFLEKVEPANKPKKKTLFGLSTPFEDSNLIESSRNMTGLKSKTMDNQSTAAGETIIEVEDKDKPLLKSKSNKCSKIKAWSRARRDCFTAPFKTMLQRILESEKLTCFFFTAMIVLGAIICILIIVFPIIESFQEHKK